MNAEEMFKECGYKCFKYSNYTLYEHDTEAALEFAKRIDCFFWKTNKRKS